MAYTIPGFLKTLTEWLVSVSRWFDGWDITILVPALIILTVIAGVTGRAATGPRLWMQLVWGTVTVILGLIEVAIIWTIIARYLPVADMGTLIQNMLQRKSKRRNGPARRGCGVGGTRSEGSNAHANHGITFLCVAAICAATHKNSPD